MNKTIKGGDLMVFANGKSMACATSHTRNVQMEVKQTSSKDSGGKWDTSEAGIISWSAQSENIATTGSAGLTEDDLLKLMIEREPVHLVMGPKKETGDNVPDAGWTPADGKGWEGDAFITGVQSNMPNGDNATFTVDFTGTGPLTPIGTAAPASAPAKN